MQSPNRAAPAATGSPTATVVGILEGADEITQIRPIAVPIARRAGAQWQVAVGDAQTQHQFGQAHPTGPVAVTRACWSGGAGRSGSWSAGCRPGGSWSARRTSRERTGHTTVVWIELARCEVAILRRSIVATGCVRLSIPLSQAATDQGADSRRSIAMVALFTGRALTGIATIDRDNPGPTLSGGVAELPGRAIAGGGASGRRADAREIAWAAAMAIGTELTRKHLLAGRSRDQCRAAVRQLTAPQLGLRSRR
jgi:hypothetical protein